MQVSIELAVKIDSQAMEEASVELIICTAEFSPNLDLQTLFGIAKLMPLPFLMLILTAALNLAACTSPFPLFVPITICCFPGISTVI